MSFTQNSAGVSTSTGLIWMNPNGWGGGPTVSFTTSYVEMRLLSTSFTLFSNAADFAMSSDGRLKYTGSQTRNFIASAYFTTPTSGSYAIQLSKNGTGITGAESYGQANMLELVTYSVTTSLATNDYLSLFVKRSAATTGAIIQITISARSVFP